MLTFSVLNTVASAIESPLPSPSPLLAGVSLARRELVRFFRQPHRVIGAVATPLLFWLLIGAGVGRSFNGAGGTPENYLSYFYPGTILMVLLFTAIFSTISVIEDRREGFLQGVLVAPVPRFAIVLGKVLGGGALAFTQGAAFLLLAPLLGLWPSLPHLLAALLIMALLSVGLTALGLIIAWRMTSTQGFHAVMNLLLMPMWFLSGALFPVSGAWSPLGWVMRLNPLTWGLAGLRQCLNPLAVSPLSLGVNVLITALFTAVLFAGASLVASGRTKADLQ